jgi:hypothetical protein
MPKTMDRDLIDCLRRANPYVEHYVEISAPDVGVVLRRPDQFVTLMVPGSMTPADSLVTGERGLELAVTSATLASFTGTQSSYDLNSENAQRRLKGMRWEVDSSFNRAVLRSFTAKITRQFVVPFAPPPLDFELQIFKWTRVPGGMRGPGGELTPFTKWIPAPLLNPSAIVPAASIPWVSNAASINFPLRNYGLAVDGEPPRNVSPDQVGEPNNYYFSVRPINPPQATGLFSWKTDTGSSHDVAGVGAFERVFWNRESEDQEWAETAYGDIPTCTIEIDTYPSPGQAVFAVDLARDPVPGAIGRVVLEGLFPRGTTTTLEISDSGPSGPWVPVKNGDLVT